MTVFRYFITAVWRDWKKISEILVFSQLVFRLSNGMYAFTAGPLLEFWSELWVICRWSLFLFPFSDPTNSGGWEYVGGGGLKAPSASPLTRALQWWKTNAMQAMQISNAFAVTYARGGNLSLIFIGIWKKSASVKSHWLWVNSYNWSKNG